MTPEFRNWVERARSERISAVLARRGIELPGRGNRRAGPCPNCGGTDRFAVDLEKEIFNCRGCQGKGHGAISFVMFLDGTPFLGAVETINGEPPPTGGEQQQRKPRKRAERGALICTYSYTDEYDVLGYQVLRFEPKAFAQRRPDPREQGEWIDNLEGVRLMPYRLSDVLEGIALGHPIYIVEGEKDSDNGAKLGLVTTTTAMGTAGKGHWVRGAYDEFFAGADVVLVPDQDGGKGTALAREIGKRLKPIAASVRVLTLPVKDLSLWIEGGGTRDAFDALPLEDFVEPNGHANGHDKGGAGLAQDWQPPWEPPGEKAQAKPPVPVRLIYPFPIIAEDIPRRAWLVPGLLLRRHVSVLVAPPGSGKSLLTLQLAIMSATGMSWGGWHPRGNIKTLIINSEDDADEMRRRLSAAVDVMREKMEINDDDLRERIAIADQPETIIIAKSDARTKTVMQTPMFKNIIATINEGKFDVVIIDPFAESFEGDENSNSELKWAAVLWREIARSTNCAVLLVHHTRKYATGGAGDMDAARGAGALVGVARVVSTVFTMTEQEAQTFSLDAEQRHEYLRFDDAKANLSLVTFKARWFRKRTCTLPNGDDEHPADQVGALVPWAPKTVFDKVDIALARTILLTIDKGMPNGDLYTLNQRGKSSTRWAGAVVQGHIECPDKEAQKLLNRWCKSGVLKEVSRETSTSKGQARNGLKVVTSKLPGTVVEEV